MTSTDQAETQTGTRTETDADAHARPVERSPAPAVSRALRILTLLEQADGTALPLGDIARGIDAAKSSTSNLCQALEEGGMIVGPPRASGSAGGRAGSAGRT